MDDLLQNYSQEARKVSCCTDPWSCVFCTSVLEDPVTLTCGHSTCKRCLLRDLTTVCRKCKVKYEPIEEDPIDVEPYVKVNDWRFLSTFVWKTISLSRLTSWCASW